MINRLKEAIRRGESSAVGPGLWFVTVYIIIFLRNCLENLEVYQVVPETSPFNLLHFPIFFLTAFLWVLVILHSLTGERIERVSRLSLFVFPVVLTPPLLDWTLNRFFHYEVAYTYVFADLGTHLLNFFNPWHAIPGVPWGLRIELLVICAMVFTYILFKRNNYGLALAGGGLVFGACLFLGSLPALIMGGMETFVIPVLNDLRGAPHKAVFDQNVLVITELFFCAGGLAVWFFNYDAAKARDLFYNLRFSRFLHYLLMAGLGMKLFFAASPGDDDLLFVKGLGALAGLFFAFQFAVVTNDIFDREGDAVSSPTRPLLNGRWQTKEYGTVGWVYLALAGLFSFWVSDACFMATMFYVAVACLYSLPPFRLRRFVLASSLILGLEAAVAFLIGQVSLNYENPGAVTDPLAALVVFLIFALACGVKDFKDVDGDRRMNIQTLPILLGEDKARLVQGVLLMVSYLLIPGILFSRLTQPVAMVVVSIIFAIGNYVYMIRKDSHERVIFILYFFYAAILLIFLR